ncbi:Bax inhibitor-1/YccA family membrane protein [Paeniglutamicibacter sp. R2-26]|uniref:Bax inhibitor-1/YccA family membrane protein n=1 Tax=Paeniglutamicibacter sp. R2-26 TaxID=3144417 RepID=UPI003EE42A36
MSTNPTLKSLRKFERSPLENAAEAVTVKDIAEKTLLCFGLVIIGFAIGRNVLLLGLIGFVVSLVLGLVIGFTRSTNRRMITTYAFAEGLILGAISDVLNTAYPGVAVQAVVATLCVALTVHVLHANDKIRTTKRSNAIFTTVLIAYALFSLANVFLMVLGLTEGMFGLRNGWLGVVAGL